MVNDNDLNTIKDSDPLFSIGRSPLRESSYVITNEPHIRFPPNVSVRTSIFTFTLTQRQELLYLCIKIQKRKMLHVNVYLLTIIVMINDSLNRS